MNSQQKEKHVVFNTQILYEALVLCVILCGCIVTFLIEEYIFAIVFLIYCILSVLWILFAPIYVVFTEQSVTVVYLWGIKERIDWRDIHDISESGRWFSKYDPLPKYHVAYPKKEKYPFFVNGSIPKIKKTKRLIGSFYNGEIEKI